MSSEENLQLFENQPIRTAWDAEAEEWFFSISRRCRRTYKSAGCTACCKILERSESAAEIGRI